MAGKRKKVTVIDGVNTATLTRQKLEVLALRIKEENEKEREERNFFQMERDKIRTFWEISLNELHEARAAIRNKNRQIEEKVEDGEDTVRKYKQKVKFCQMEFENQLAETKEAALISINNLRKEYDERERTLLDDKTSSKVKANTQELSHANQVHCLKLQHAENISEVREQYQTKARQLEYKYEIKFQELMSELDLKHKTEMFQLEEQKNSQINALVKHHEEAFKEMQLFYNDVVLNNISVIAALKNQMENVRIQNERMNSMVNELVSDNKKLVEPLKKANEDVQELKRQLQNYSKDKSLLEKLKVILSDTRANTSDLQLKYDALSLAFEKLEFEKIELQNRFQKAILDVQEKTATKNLMLQKRVSVLYDEVEEKDLAIEDFTNKLQPGTYPVLSRKIRNIIKQKNSKIQDLKYELSRVIKAHDDLLKVIHDKLRSYGIPPTELGFVPLRFLPEGQCAFSEGPAGLVAKNR